MGTRAVQRAYVQATLRLPWGADIQHAWETLLWAQARVAALPRAWKRKMEAVPHNGSSRLMALHSIVLKDFEGPNTDMRRRYIAAIWLRQLASVIVSNRISR